MFAPPRDCAALVALLSGVYFYHTITRTCEIESLFLVIVYHVLFYRDLDAPSLLSVPLDLTRPFKPSF